MRRNKEVVAKRGCTCCGTGCVLIGAIVPISIVALWETVGAVAALMLWPALLAGAHGVRRLRIRPYADLDSRQEER
jgi:hypothetical protein